MATSIAAKEARRKRKSAERPARERQLSRLHQPHDLTPEEWQAGLRRQFGKAQAFSLKNLGDQPFFSEFLVTNPESKRSYRVAIRGTQPGDNYCSCPDFATNNLGTCKHVEYTLAALERKRGGAKALKAGFQPPYSEIYLWYGARRELRFRPGGDCPVELARLAAKYFGPDGTLIPEAMTTLNRFLSKSEEFDHELRFYDDARAFLAECCDAVRRGERIAEAFPKGIESAAFKKLLKTPLYAYQREGALFAAKAGRCLIGDEMGLGKTIQAIAAAEIMARHLGVERALIVCPTSLKHQWEREIERFSGRSVGVIGGPLNERRRQFESESFFKVMNYDTIHRDLAAIEGWSPDLVILDEAQRIKNWNTRVARSVKEIASPYAIVLTGTPLENRLEELVSIVQFIDRHRLGPTWRILHDHQLRDEAGRVVGYQRLDEIGKTLEPILIRRQKDQVLKQLPARLDKNFFVPMTESQRDIHEENREVVARLVFKWRRYKFLSDADQTRLRIALQRMRMSCDSTYLVDHETDFGVKADELATLLDESFERPDAKVVVFSQWVRMHELIERRFRDRDWNYVLFHGGVASADRRTLVDRFREEPLCRSFLATDAGGVGLNLQHASLVVNMDLPWNPAVLEQRIGRVHRLGQKQPVRVVNFVSQGTIEEGMLEVLRFKKSLFAGVLDGGEKEIHLGGTRLNRFMESVSQVTEGIPQADAVDPAQPAADQDVPPLDSDRARAPRAPAANGDAASEPEPVTAPDDDPWAGLMRAGLAALEQFAGGSLTAGGRQSANQIAAAALGRVERDETTGETYLKLPVPPREALDQVLHAVTGLLESLRR